MHDIAVHFLLVTKNYRIRKCHFLNICLGLGIYKHRKMAIFTHLAAAERGLTSTIAYYCFLNTSTSINKHI